MSIRTFCFCLADRGRKMMATNQLTLARPCDSSTARAVAYQAPATTIVSAQLPTAMAERPELAQNMGRDVQIVNGPKGHLAFYGKHKV